MEERRTDVHGAEQRLMRARNELKAAMARLADVRRAALRGDLDSEALDEAVLTCRAAQSKVRAAREALEREWMSALDRSVPAQDALEPAAEGSIEVREAQAPPEPLEITPRLLFARWLVQTGRLTDDVTARELQPAA